MVTVAQLAERWIVVPNVVGSSPISHPKRERRTRVLLFFCYALYALLALGLLTLDVRHQTIKIINITEEILYQTRRRVRSLLSANEELAYRSAVQNLPVILIIYRCTGTTLAITIGIGIARLQAHSLHLCLAFLLHSALYAEGFHIGIGGYFGLYGVPFDHLCEREGEHKKAHHTDTYENYYKSCRHFLIKNYFLSCKNSIFA